MVGGRRFGIRTKDRQGPFPRDSLSKTRVLRPLCFCLSFFLSTRPTLPPLASNYHERLGTIAFSCLRQTIRALRMPKAVSLSFLGTCSGGGPLLNRSCSSSLLDIAGVVWSKCDFLRGTRTALIYICQFIVVDCAEGTLKQLMLSGVKVGRVRRIFTTHMHGTLQRASLQHRRSRF